jgi:predicted enzyme related to lactoylglutathione lyase
VYGQSLKELVLAIVSLGDGISIEIFEFTDPKYDGPVTTKDWSPDVYTRGGSFHFCLTVADPEAVSTEAVRLGGKLVNNLTEVAPGEKCQYVQDPWGNVIELLSCSHQMLFVKIFAGMATAAGVSLG